MRVEVWSDVVCPWCYVGKRRFERALTTWRAEGGADVEIVWRPFQLDPNTPNDGAPMPDALAAKFGGMRAAEQAMTQVSGVAAGEGLEYRLADAVQANTFDAHRVIARAYEQGGAELQGAVQERLFRAHFCEAEHIGDPEVLARLAGEAGMDDVASALTDEVLAERVRAELAEGLAIGVRSVPTFVVGRKGVSGAQEPDVLLELLRAG
ncbi:DsbA family oxidoreductase [Solihabitans fulvus]|uniref:DsbA family oxidoreductase n=1 Tax=Solihabitans fulvus TaxID=1892852 RepID=UPI001CB760B7|nr:DsbA family oxidoreductase [Solihabitans fulvus]